MPGTKYIFFSVICLVFYVHCIVLFCVDNYLNHTIVNLIFKQRMINLEHKIINVKVLQESNCLQFFLCFYLRFSGVLD